MDKFETNSNASDSPGSNLSSLSGLTGFEEEFYTMKSLIDSKTQPFFADSINNNHFNERNNFPDCYAELQKALLLNEKYKNDLTTLERKIELANHEKFDKLLRRNLQLESELARSSVVNTQENDFIEKLSEARHQISHMELVNVSLKRKYEEMKIDLDTKSTSILGLKKKIVDLHIELQMLNVSNTKLNNDLHVAHNNFNSLKKSELWYKEQLHANRLQKSVLNQEIARLRDELIRKEHELNGRIGERLRLINLLKELQRPEGDEPSASVDAEAYEHTISTLRSELVALKKAVETRRCSFAKENEELVKSNQRFRAAIDDKDALITNLENVRRDLVNEIEILKSNVKDTADLLSKTVAEKSELEVTLIDARKEKTDVECAINLIRSDFSKFAKRYNMVKDEALRGDRLKRRLEEEKAQLENVNDKLMKDLRNSSAKVAALENECKRRQLEELDFSRKSNELLQLEKDKQRRRLRNLKHRVKQVEIRCKVLHQRNLADEEEMSALKECSFKIVDDNEAVKNLRALCKAKDLEIKEKRLKYEASYRTLLRKVKEHMRARNAVEKRCLYLQELHDSVFEELNSYKLQAAFQKNDHETARLEHEITVLRAKEAFAKAQLEDQIATCQNEQRLKEQFQKESHNKDIVIAQMEDEVRQSVVKIQELTANKVELERLLNAQKELSEKCDLERARYNECLVDLEETKRMLQQAQTQNELSVEDLKALSKDVEFKVSQLAEAVQQKHLFELKSKRDEDAICCLQTDVQSLQNDLRELKSDKYFLQRLCNDLKFALTTTKNQNDVLKKHIQTLSVEHSSPPNSLDAPSPRQFDETYINELLQRSVGYQVDKPLDNLHSSLNLLKNEMASLRRQVVENSLCKF
ncbi:hypothetical protein FQR65_LT12345 [Abscondita terminalis]|nr:hypothetical protein FQR65_LT12345 [Abscondita terminalis]